MKVREQPTPPADAHRCHWSRNKIREHWRHLIGCENQEVGQQPIHGIKVLTGLTATEWTCLLLRSGEFSV